MAEKIQYTDTLRQGTDKLNASIEDANTAKDTATQANSKSEQAVNTANTAETKADSVQQQFNNVVIEGDSSVEAAQARVKEDGSSFDTLRDRLNSSDANLAQNKTDISQRGINIWDYIDHITDRDVIADQNLWDWTDAIIRAINDAYNNGISKIVFPHYGTGDYLMSPISFEGYNNIALIGLGSTIDLNVPYRWGDEGKPTKHVRFKFINEGEVGLQFSDTSNPNPTWKASYCIVENIWLCGNDMVNTVANGNYGVVFKNVFASHAINDGITFEDFAYPALIENSQLGANGRHGLYAKGPMSTAYNLRRVNTANNGGYGYHIDGGSSISFDDCFAHLNKTGGLKITKRNDLYGTQPNNFLNNLIFNNFYAEANGTREELDPLYEGNFALVVDRVGSQNVTGRLNAQNIIFNGGALNASQNGKTYNIESVFGFTFNKTTVDHNKGVVNAGESVGLDISASITTASANAPYPFISKYFTRDQNMPILVHKGGFISERGRVVSMPFVVDSLTHGQNIPMRLATSEKNNEWVTHGYPISKGSIVGVKLFTTKSRKTESSIRGNISLSITRNEFKDESNGLTYYLQDFLTLDLNTERYTEYWFGHLEHAITDNFVGLRVKASSDYVNSTSYPTIFGYLLLEF